MNTKRLALIVGAVFIMAAALAPSAWAVSSAGFTTTNTAVDGTGHCQNGNEAVNCNIYDGKEFVWMNGGPVSASLGDGSYFFAVLVPGGQADPNDGSTKNLSDDVDAYTNRTFTVSGGIVSYSGSHSFDCNKIRLADYADTSNNGGVYIMAICSLANGYPVDPTKCKYDAFKAPGCEENCDPGDPNTIVACKYFDANANGSLLLPPDSLLAGWPMTISPQDGTPDAPTQYTTQEGCVSWTQLTDGVYTVIEGVPSETNWFNSDPGPNPTPLTNTASVFPFKTVAVTGDETEVLDFGNFCKAPSGGLTLGFWSNKNGFDKMNDNGGVGPELALLSGLHLRDASGADFNPGCYCKTGACPPGVSTPTCTTPFRTWILSATATNMAYMLSAQLAAMELNVEAGLVAGNAFDLCSSKTITALMAEAEAALAASPITKAVGLARNNQERLKNCLDALNNGGLVVPPATSCSATNFTSIPTTE